eukprot:789590_1
MNFTAQFIPFSLCSVPCSVLLEYKEELDLFHQNQLAQMIEYNNAYQITTHCINQELQSRNIIPHPYAPLPIFCPNPIITISSPDNACINASYSSNQDSFQYTQNMTQPLVDPIPPNPPYNPPTLQIHHIIHLKPCHKMSTKSRLF